jgi:SAM-dependent methyltransferase
MSTQAHWQDVYTRKSANEVSWYQSAPVRSLEWIRACAPDPASAILDVGAGASTLVDHLLDAGYSKLGVLDLAPSALAATRNRLGERASTVEWFTADVTEFVAPHPFDVWHDRAVLHFLVDTRQQHRYAEVLRRTLRPGGHALIAAFAHGGPTRCSGLDVVQLDCDEIADLLGPGFECVRSEQELHSTPGGAEQRFQYCLFRRGPA